MNHLFALYALAVKAKEKGFDELCMRYYNTSKTLTSSIFEEGQRSSDLNSYCSAAPTYQQLVDWFRKEHNIRFSERFWLGNWCWFILKGTEEEAMSHTLPDALIEAFKLIP